MWRSVYFVGMYGALICIRQQKGISPCNAVVDIPTVASNISAEKKFYFSKARLVLFPISECLTALSTYFFLLLLAHTGIKG